MCAVMSGYQQSQGKHEAESRDRERPDEIMADAYRYHKGNPAGFKAKYPNGASSSSYPSSKWISNLPPPGSVGRGKVTSRLCRSCQHAEAFFRLAMMPLLQRQYAVIIAA
jgi:hypothetical protein